MEFESTIELVFEYLTSGVRGALSSQASRLQELHEQPSLVEALRLVNALPYALELREAPTDLKARILATIASEKMRTVPHQHEHAPHAPVFSPGELIIQRKNEGVWVNPGVPGLSFKTLYTDHVTGYLTMLVRMEPGATYPGHHHAGYEECFMLEGEVRSGELQLFAGDYQRLSGGTVHQALYSEAGCMFLVVASEHNELI